MDWATLIHQFGFPIVMCIWFMRREKAIAEERRLHWETVSKMSDRMEKLAVTNTIIIRAIDEDNREDRKLLSVPRTPSEGQED